MTGGQEKLDFLNKRSPAVPSRSTRGRQILIFSDLIFFLSPPCVLSLVYFVNSSETMGHSEEFPQLSLLPGLGFYFVFPRTRVEKPQPLQKTFLSPCHSGPRVGRLNEALFIVVKFTRN